MIDEWRGSSYLCGGNAPVIEALYYRYLEDPASVEPRWRGYFDELQKLDDGPGDVSHSAVQERFVALAKETKNPDVLITVDNGIASIDGVAAANAAGMRVWVTDHHLPGAELPAAECIINPNQPGCGFPSKNLAGVGVICPASCRLFSSHPCRGRCATGAETD